MHPHHIIKYVSVLMSIWQLNKLDFCQNFIQSLDRWASEWQSHLFSCFAQLTDLERLHVHCCKLQQPIGSRITSLTGWALDGPFLQLRTFEGPTRLGWYEELAVSWESLEWEKLFSGKIKKIFKDNIITPQNLWLKYTCKQWGVLTPECRLRLRVRSAPLLCWCQ